MLPVDHHAVMKVRRVQSDYYYYFIVFISPNNGNELGGTPVIVRGPCFNDTDNITCDFGDITVPGVKVSINTALCISPLFNINDTSVWFVLKSNGSIIGDFIRFYLRK